MRPPKSAEVNTHATKVRFFVKVVAYANSLETRIEQLERSVKKMAKAKTKIKETKNEK